MTPKSRAKNSITILLAGCFFFLIGCLSNDQISDAPKPMDRIPTFNDFPVKTIYNQTPRPINVLSHPRAIHFQDRLIEGAAKGPNFAGHYTIVKWDCGEECQQMAIIDARTGSVIFAPFITHLGFQFQINSRLLIVNPPEAVDRAAQEGNPKSHYKTVYYVWHFDRFVEVYAIRYP